MSNAADRLRQANHEIAQRRQQAYMLAKSRPAPADSRPATRAACTVAISLQAPAQPKRDLAPVVAVPDMISPRAVLPAPWAIRPADLDEKEAASQARALAALDLSDVALALSCVPSAYNDCREPVRDLRAHGASEGEAPALFLLEHGGGFEALSANFKRVSSAPYESMMDAPYKGYWEHVRQLRLQVRDESGIEAWISRFDPWAAKSEPRAGKLLVRGQLKRSEYDGRLYIGSATYLPAYAAGRVWPRYAGIRPSEGVVRALVNQALADPQAPERCAMELVNRTLMSREQLLGLLHNRAGLMFEYLEQFILALHAPESPDHGRRLADAARMLATAVVCHLARAASVRAPHPRSAIAITRALQEQLIDSQPEALTEDQRTVITQLCDALREPQPLNGQLSGDVGTGKTLSFAVPAVAAHLSGARVAMVSPTEILANQLAATLEKRFPQAQVERVRAGARIKNPLAILVGTSGLGTVARKSNYEPDLLIVDEQHKLSTSSRDSMFSLWTHRLEASATPIPRSLASTLFSGMKVFQLRQAPVERQIASVLLQESERIQAAGWMRECMAEGHRVAVIYPRVTPEQLSKAQKQDDDDAVPELLHRAWAEDAKAPAQSVASVSQAADALSQRFGAGVVGMLHGQMPAQEVERTLQQFRDGQVRLIVASTIMETGIDVPDIRLVIIKDAHCFGAAQLHQLRGRLARNGGAGRFVMMVPELDKLGVESLERLETVRDVSDGYKLAEADMKSRGMGQLDGSAQSGQVKSAFARLKLGLLDFVRESRF